MRERRAPGLVPAHRGRVDVAPATLQVLDVPLLLENPQQSAHRGITRRVRQPGLNLGYAGGTALVKNVHDLPFPPAELHVPPSRHAKKLAYDGSTVKLYLLNF